MYVAPQEISFDQLPYSSLGGSSPNPYGSVGMDADNLLAPNSMDNVSRFQPSGDPQQIEQQALGALDAAAQTAANPLGSPLASLASLLSQLAGSLGGAGSSPQSCHAQPGPLQPPWSGSMQPPCSGSQQPFGQQQFFQNANGASAGDPHLSFDGTNAGGQTTDAEWNNMASQKNLLDSNSFSGGYRIRLEPDRRAPTARRTTKRPRLTRTAARRAYPWTPKATPRFMPTARGKPWPTASSSTWATAKR